MKLKKNDAKIHSKMIKLDELNWKQIEGLDKDKTILFLPISPLEEHGPHLPVGTDIFTAKDTSIEAIKILNKKKPDLTCVLIPAIPLGFIPEYIPLRCAIAIWDVDIIINLNLCLARDDPIP